MPSLNRNYQVGFMQCTGELSAIGFRTRWYAYLRGPPNMPNYALGALAGSLAIR